MLEGLLGLLAFMLILGIIGAAVLYFIRILPIDEPIKSWARIVVIAIGLLIFIIRALPLIGVHV